VKGEKLMSELEDLLGKDLFNAVRLKMGNLGLIIDNGMLIPKHRFDCINISLKEHKEKVITLSEKNEELKRENSELKKYKEKYISENDELLIYRELSEFKLKNITSVRSLININGLHGDELKAYVIKQVKKLKKTDSYLFYDENQKFILVPCGRIKKTEKK